MALTDEDIIKFKELYMSEFGIELTNDEALEKSAQLLSLMSAICKPINRNLIIN